MTKVSRFRIGQVVKITTLGVYDRIAYGEYYPEGKQWLYWMAAPALASLRFSEEVLQTLTKREKGSKP